MSTEVMPIATWIVPLTVRRCWRCAISQRRMPVDKESGDFSWPHILILALFAFLNASRAFWSAFVTFFFLTRLLEKPLWLGGAGGGRLNFSLLVGSFSTHC